ncbi:DgyrCDS1036 [Dimorphilus gyrociliatus]|uniref:DgyrCDS1036 n=1 Tax=Dimorphilus gyrociliatus TaxID=2664684 RepID=A0A7I8V973_9ANNE|nr:DgyrCDS1036 [Dimorphilus gyrociliatus]
MSIDDNSPKKDSLLLHSCQSSFSDKTRSLNEGKIKLLLICGIIFLFVGLTSLSVAIWLITSSECAIEESHDKRQIQQLSLTPSNSSTNQSVNQSEWEHDRKYDIDFERLRNSATVKNVVQSSTRFKRSYALIADLAIDGKKVFNLKTSQEPSCSQTDFETNPFFIIDLGHKRVISSIYLIFPFDYPLRTQCNFKVQVGIDKLEETILCREHLGIPIKPNLLIDCQRPIYGRYLRIELLDIGIERSLSICEVAVLKT